MYEDIDYDAHHVGEFDLDGDIFSGELIFNRKKGGIVLHLTKELTDEELFSKHYGIIDSITGKLSSGVIVTLFNNRCIKNHTENFKVLTLNFMSDYFIWSNKEKRLATYNKMISVLGNAYQWSGFSMFERVSGGIKVVDDIPKKVYEWFGMKITFSPWLNNYVFYPFQQEETKIIQKLSITMESSNKMPVGEFIKIRNIITSLISFAIKDNVNVDNEVLVDFDDCYTQYLNGVEYTEPYKHSLITSEAKLNVYSSGYWDYNFQLKQLSEDESLNLKLEKLRPIFNLYLSLIKYPEMPYEMVFLNIVQALETFHSRFFYDNKKKEYIKSVNERFGSSQNFETYKKLLLCQTQMDENCNYIILVSRLNDLFIRGNNGLFREYYLEENYAQKIADTRHYYTHYGEQKESKALKGNALLDAIYILRLLLEYHICLILGIDNTSNIKRYLRTQSSHQEV